MEFEQSAIFLVKLVTKNIVIGSLGTHFMHMRVNQLSLFRCYVLTLLRFNRCQFSLQCY